MLPLFCVLIIIIKSKHRAYSLAHLVVRLPAHKGQGYFIAHLIDLNHSIVAKALESASFERGEVTTESTASPGTLPKLNANPAS